MAEAILGVVAEGVVSKALSFAAQEMSGALAVREDLETLAQQLEMIQAVLADAESKPLSSGPVRVWVERLKDAAADADMLLDDFAYELLRKNKIHQKGNKVEKVRTFFTCSNPLVFRFDMAHKIKKINSCMKEIFQDSVNIGLKPVEITNYAADLRKVTLTDPFLDDSKIVGRVDDVRNIVSRLIICSNDENDLPVIGIVGMPGQGKTTLAKLLLKDDEVKKHFEKRIWVCVSDDFNVDKILKDVLQSLTGAVSTSTIREPVVNEVKKAIDGKMFLLVLDNVWNENPELWENMKNCLLAIGGANGSRVIVTTRNEGVVEMMNGFVYRLGVLSKEASKELFEKIAFGNGRAEKAPELVKIGERMVQRCGGVPLAVKAIASLMSTKRHELQWKQIEDSSLCIESDIVLASIRLSFDHLPSVSLKQCFAYCSIFPKDSVMNRETLIQLWMANGFLNPSRESKLEMEDIGNNYFNTLLRRSLFQEAEYDEHGSIKSCKMHDIVQDFAIQASKDWCLTIDDGSRSENIKTVHLSIISRGSRSLNISTRSFSKLRTLVLFDIGSISLDDLENCKYIHVFVLNDGSVRKLPNFIVRLKHLTYLDISKTSIQMLPSSISNLYNLQTLRVSPTLKFPREFENLVNLRNICMAPEYLTIRPSIIRGISKLTFLRKLPYFMVSKDGRCGIKELQYLQNLEGSLRIFDLENVSNCEEAMKADLPSKRNIMELKLHWNSDLTAELKGSCEGVLEGLKPNSHLKHLTISKFAGKSLPSWMARTSHQSVIHNLVTLKLESLYRCEKIPPLGHLPFLKSLNISRMGSVKCIGKEWYGWTNQTADQGCSIVSFPSLINLELDDMSDLEQWSDPHGLIQVFPRLEILEVNFAPKLTRLPQLFNILSSLKRLKIYKVSLIHLLESLGGMTSLEELYIRDCPSLVSIPSIQGLRSLREFTIISCNKLEGFPYMLEACVGLQRLSIRDCSSIRFEDLCLPANLRGLRLDLSSEDGVDYQVFPWPKECTVLADLETLRLEGTPKMESLMSELHLPKLRRLSIVSFDEMKVIPDWLCYIQSLQSLWVWRCPKLTYLPTKIALQSLTHGSKLTFDECPILKERCEKGPEQQKIANLTNIRLEFHDI